MEKDKKTSGAMVGLMIILIVLIIGGVYTWKSKVKDAPDNQQVFAPITVEDEEELDALLEDLGASGTAEEEPDFESLE